MTREKELINHIQEYLDSNMWKYEACNLSKDDLELIIKALEQELCEYAISRVEVLEQINCWVGSGECRYTNATWYLFKRINELPSIQSKTRWIPVSERRPPKLQDVLVTDGYDVYIAWYGERGAWHTRASGCNQDLYDIVAWMPLPAPYKESEE